MNNLHPIFRDIVNVYTSKPKKYSKASHEEEFIADFVLGFVNHVERHRIDMDKLLGQVSNIVGDIERLALEVENGEYELPEQERDE